MKSGTGDDGRTGSMIIQRGVDNAVTGFDWGIYISTFLSVFYTLIWLGYYDRFLDLLLIYIAYINIPSLSI